MRLPAAPPGAPCACLELPPPPGYHLEHRISRPLVIAGSVIFGISYLGVVATGIAYAATGYRIGAWSLVPIGGSIALSSPGVPFEVLVADAAVQAIGIGLLSAGLVGTRGVVANRSSARRPPLLPLLGPTAGPGVTLRLIETF